MPLLPPGEVRVTGALLASDGGFTLHAATVAAGREAVGREALVRYALGPPLAQERLKRASNDLVELALKRPFSDGTYAVQLDPLSLLRRLIGTVPPPRFHTVRYAGALAPASRLRSRIVPPCSTENTDDGGRLHDDQRSTPAAPPARRQHPEPAIGVGQPGPFD